MLSPNLPMIYLGIAVLVAVLIIAALSEIVGSFWERRKWRLYKKSMATYYEGVPALNERLAQQNQRQLELINSRDVDDHELFNKVEEYRNDFGGPGETS